MSGVINHLVAGTQQELNDDILAVNSDAPGNYTIDFTASPIESGLLPTGIGGGLYAIDLPAGVTLTINGMGFTLNGQGVASGIDVVNGKVTIENLTIEDTIAQGGNGLGAAGGGAGLGGGLFVGRDATVILQGVTITGDKAKGGNGGPGGFGWPGGNASPIIDRHGAATSGAAGANGASGGTNSLINPPLRGEPGSPGSNGDFGGFTDGSGAVLAGGRGGNGGRGGRGQTSSTSGPGGLGGRGGNAGDGGNGTGGRMSSLGGVFTLGPFQAGGTGGNGGFGGNGGSSGHSIHQGPNGTIGGTHGVVGGDGGDGGNGGIGGTLAGGGAGGTGGAGGGVNTNLADNSSGIGGTGGNGGNGGDGATGGFGAGGGGGGNGGAGAQGGVTNGQGGNGGNGGFGGLGGFGGGGGGGGDGGAGGLGGFTQDGGHRGGSAGTAGSGGAGAAGGFGAGHGGPGAALTANGGVAGVGGGGGGGLGAGGDIFVQQGGTLVMDGGLVSAGSVQGGNGGPGGTAGSAIGAGIFWQGFNSVSNFVLGAPAGKTVVISSAITDQSGAGGSVPSGTVSGFTVVGPGTVDLASPDNDFSGTVMLNGGTLEVASEKDDEALLDFGAPAKLVLDYANGAVSWSDPINDFTVGDTIVVNGFVETSFFYFQDDLVMSNGSASATLDLPGLTLTTFDVVGDSINNNTTITVACFAEGTRIATPAGDVAVEQLTAGDLVLTHDGAAAPVVWLGRRRIDCARHPDPREVWPVRVSAGAFGPGLPARDLYLSPDHAVFVDAVLIPVKYLIDGRNIVQVKTASVTYFHVELPEHGVLCAEGLPTESFLDNGDRAKFENAGGTVQLFPNFSAVRREALGCAPLIVCGPVVDAVRDSVARREVARAA